MKGFYHIWAWRPSWSCDPDAANKISFPLPKEAPHKIWLYSAQRFRRRRCLKLFTTTPDGRRLDGYPISSPCEPNGSGELKSLTILMSPYHSLIHSVFFAELEHVDPLVEISCLQILSENIENNIFYKGSINSKSN